MHSIKGCVLSLSCLFSFWVLTDATALSGLFPQIRDTKDNNGTKIKVFNGSLTDVITKPWGPDEFTISVQRTSTPMDPLGCYMFIIEALGKLAVEDFNGQLPNTINNFDNTNYPDFYAGVTARGPGRKIPRRYAFWGLARVMNHVVRNDFRGGAYELQWRGRKVGSILLISGPIQQSLSSLVAADFGESILNATSHRQVPTADDQTQIQNSTQSSFENSQISWSYVFLDLDDEMTQSDVFMGTIGALVEAAQYSGPNIDMFFGGFPPFKAIHSYLSYRTPSVFSKNILVQTLVNVASKARTEMDFHEMRTQVNDTLGIIAQGGYLRAPEIGPVANLNLSNA